MPAQIDLPTIKAIRVDYEAKHPDGRPVYPVHEVARRNGVSVGMVNAVRRAWGMRRYSGHGPRP